MSVRRTKANVKNARSSSGPKTRLGKARSAQNARRHGLSVPVLRDPNWSKDVRVLARTIVGKDSSPEQRELARRITAAQIDVLRARRLRLHLINAIVDGFGRTRPKLSVTRQKARHVSEQLGYDAPLPINVARDLLKSRKEEVFGPGLETLLWRLEKLDRYERRALSLRKFAIRAFAESKRWVLTRRPGPQ